MIRAPLPPPPDTWEPARRVAERLIRPLERFLRIEAASGIVLLVAAVVALAWANSPWSASYESLWSTPVTFGVGRFGTTETLHFWIDDGLMTIFFFVVGLEIRRELYAGELSDAKRAALPVAAAVGGMVVPAVIFLSMNTAPEVVRGWGVPMATDIAFAVGALALLGKRVPPALRVLVLALAIIDDIGAILVIAVFYSRGVDPIGLLIAAGGALGIVLLQRFGVRRAVTYLIPGAIIWLGMLRAGVHPTIAGVVVGLMTPVRPWLGKEGFVAAVGDAMEELREHTDANGSDAHEMLQPLRQIKQAHREVLPPVVRVQAELHPWVAFGIMPLFAFANAGVSLRGLEPASGGFTSIVLGVVLGLVLGKPIGILLASIATVRLGICSLPRGVRWSGVAVVGCVGGIGFTMAIFVAGLAFTSPALLGAAKLAVLMASAVAAVVGLVLGRLVLPATPAPGAALTVGQAEASTEQ